MDFTDVIATEETVDVKNEDVWVLLPAVVGFKTEVELMLVLEAREESLYNSKRFPAPQYSTLLPGHMKLQSPAAARLAPTPRLLPQ